MIFLNKIHLKKFWINYYTKSDLEYEILIHVNCFLNNLKKKKKKTEGKK